MEERGNDWKGDGYHFREPQRVCKPMKKQRLKFQRRKKSAQSAENKWGEFRTVGAERYGYEMEPGSEPEVELRL
jgi:hypothetical protein